MQAIVPNGRPCLRAGVLYSCLSHLGLHMLLHAGVLPLHVHMCTRSIRVS